MIRFKLLNLLTIVVLCRFSEFEMAQPPPPPYHAQEAIFQTGTGGNALPQHAPRQDTIHTGPVYAQYAQYVPRGVRLPPHTAHGSSSGFSSNGRPLLLMHDDDVEEKCNKYKKTMKYPGFNKKNEPGILTRNCFDPTSSRVKEFIKPSTTRCKVGQVYGAFLPEICARGYCIDINHRGKPVPAIVLMLIEEIMRRVMCHQLELELFAVIDLFDASDIMEKINRLLMDPFEKYDDRTLISLFKHFFNLLVASILPASGPGYESMMEFDSSKHNNAIYISNIFKYVGNANIHTIDVVMKFLSDYQRNVNKWLPEDKLQVTTLFLAKSIAPCLVLQNRPSGNFPTHFIGYLIDQMGRDTAAKQVVETGMQMGSNNVHKLVLVPRNINIRLFGYCLAKNGAVSLCTPNQIVGKTMEDICMQRSKQCDENGVVEIVLKCMAHLNANVAHYSEHMFRNIGNVGFLTTMIQSLNRDGKVDMPEIRYLDNVPLLLKAIFLLSFEPLIPPKFSAEIVRASNPNEIWHLLQKIIAYMHQYRPIHFRNFMVLMVYLQRFITTTSNRYTSLNMATYFAPGLVRRLEGNFVETLQDQGGRIPFIMFCIENIHEIHLPSDSTESFRNLLSQLHRGTYGVPSHVPHY